ncbi:hypothetical protein [Bradyrhizobium septentrionale]|uniref:Uncharacterized protein n=1 Tax=Bradyrhizobium septentrionale TaxID=1404411 RepID=A0ABZ2NTU6_9BRAD
MPYVLRSMIIAHTVTIEITKEEYNATLRARAAMNELIAVEEKYDALMENYVELEETLHNFGIRTLAFVERRYEDTITPLNQVSRRVSNLLSSARLYRDALPQHAARLLGRKHSEVVRLQEELKPGNPNHPMPYRQMEAVRNYAQHVGPAINDIVIDRHWEPNEENQKGRHLCAILPRMDADAISRNKRNNHELAPDLRTSLAALGKEANPMPIIRKYVEHIGTIHAGFRETVKQLEKESEELMRGLLERYAKAAPGETLVAVAVGLENENGIVLEPQYLVEHRLDYLRYLRVKHLSAASLSLRYVPW